MKQENDDVLWDKIEKQGIPCKVRLLCGCKKTYTGAGTEYTPLWSITNENVPVELDEVKRGKENVLWGKLKGGQGWIDLKQVQLYE